jgi:hypothetical protein
VSGAREDRSWPGLAAGVVVSVLAHAGAGVWVVSAASASADAGRERRSEIPVPEMLPPEPPEQQDEITLGMAASKHASITWLGVLEDPVEGRAPEAEVDQAALTTALGAETELPVQEPSPMAEASPAVEPAQAVPEAVPEPTPEVATMPPVETPEPLPQPEAMPQPAPEERPPEEVDAPPGPSLIADAPEPREEPEPEPQPEPEVTTEVEPEELTETPEVREPVVDPGEETPVETVPMGPPAPEVVEQETPAAVQPTAPAAEPTPPSAGSARPRGQEGELSEREAEAAMRKQAVDLEFDDLGRPLAGKGLEIKTVRPEWPASVRNTYRPRNAVVVIRFGADGKVRKAEFLREPDGRKGTGASAVDGPLLDAVYRWTAKGERIDALDKNDPDTEIVIPIRMLLTRPTPGG